MTTTDKNETKQRILDAALHVFCTYGYARSSTRMICSEANVNIALIHYHFKDKETLYQTVVSVYAGEIYDHFKRIFEADTDCMTKLINLYTHHLNTALSNAKGSVWRLFQRESIEPSGALNESSFDKLSPIHDLLIEFVSKETNLPPNECHALVYAINGIPSAFKQASNLVKHLSPELYPSEKTLPDLAKLCARYAYNLIKSEHK